MSCFKKIFKNYLTKLYKLCIIDIYSLRAGDKVNIFIDVRSSVPIYDQICSQIKQQIMSGELAENEMLPSIRGLAKDLKISFITTKRAYEELEKEGFIYTMPAKGCYVSPKNLELIRETNLKKIEEHIDAAIELAAACRLSSEELLEIMKFALDSSHNLNGGEK